MHNNLSKKIDDNMLWSKSIRHDGKLFSICQCTEYMYAEYGPKAMLRHVTMLDEVG